MDAKSIVTLAMILSIVTIIAMIPHISYADNQGSYEYGWQQGSLKSPIIAKGANWYPELDNNACALGGAVTNTTACTDGFFIGWKNWCTNHAIDCVGNVTLGHFPDMMLKTHQEYLRGYNAANGSGNLCPIGENAAFCTGWYNNNGEDSECGDASYSGPFSSNILVGCPLDTMSPNQMTKPHILIGTWDYVNGTISGKIVYSDYGNFTLTVPTKNAYGEYKLEGSWGSLGHNILTECYSVGACENNTLITVTPNHIEFSDPRHDVIHLMR